MAVHLVGVLLCIAGEAQFSHQCLPSAQAHDLTLQGYVGDLQLAQPVLDPARFVFHLGGRDPGCHLARYVRGGICHLIADCPVGCLQRRDALHERGVPCQS